jgi:hypothetical protein
MSSVKATIALSLSIVICDFLPKCRVANNHGALDRALIWIKRHPLGRDGCRWI